MIIKEYFKESKLNCRCGCGLPPQLTIIFIVYSLRITLRVPIYIISGARCLRHNKAEGGGESSLHLPLKDRKNDHGATEDTGALDIVIHSVAKHRHYEYDLIKTAPHLGVTGIGIKNNKMAHIDNGNGTNRPAIWTY